MDPHRPPDSGEPDSGLRRMITWTIVALVATLLFSSVAVYLVTRWFGGA